MILLKASLRYLLRHPWQTILSVVGVTLGVAVVVAIDLANGSAERAFTASRAEFTGRATHEIVGGPAGLADKVYAKLRLAGVRPAAPMVQGYATLPALPGETLQVLGVDVFAENAFRTAFTGRPLPWRELLTRPDTVVLSAQTARRAGLAPGAHFVLDVGGRRRRVILAGLLQPINGLQREALGAVVLTDIATAQGLMGMDGKLSRIDLIIPPGPAGVAELAYIRRALPPGAEILSTGERFHALNQMSRAFRLNLTALSLLSLVVGMFLIYNAMIFSVVQRRQLIGTLRALGVTRRQVFALVLGEALLIGALGTLGGIALGLGLAEGLLAQVTRTINDLYFVLTATAVTVTPLSLAKGAALGLGATVLAALAPALEATTTPVNLVLRRSTIEGRARRLVPRAAVIGLVVTASGALALALPGKGLTPAFAALFAVIAGAALAAPWAMAGLLRLLHPALSCLFGMLGRLAARSVAATLSRTGIAVAALMVAVATSVGVGIMIDSFRQTVASWLETTIQADIYVSAPQRPGDASPPTLDPALAARVAALPQVAAVSLGRRVSVQSPDGQTQLFVLKYGPPGQPAFRLKAGNPAAVWPAFAHGGAVVISEPYAYRHDLRIGDRLTLRTDHGLRGFPVAGIYYDYESDQGVVLMSRATYERYWRDRGIGALGVYARPGTDIHRLIEQIRSLVPPGELVLIRSNRALREASMKVFDRTFAITAVLRLLATAVAFAGILSALMAVQLERARELATLRAIGMTPPQVWGLVTAESGLMGLAAGVLAAPLGAALALALILVIDKRSFGWTMQIRIDPSLLVQGLLLALVAALLAGVYPAFRLARITPARALREE